jgi:hypothetical protein
MFAEENASLLKLSLIYRDIGTTQYHIYKFDCNPCVFEYLWQFYEEDEINLEAFTTYGHKTWRKWALVQHCPLCNMHLGDL